MGSILYIQTDKNCKIEKAKVQLQDVAELTCDDPAILQKCKVIQIKKVPEGRYGRYVLSAVEMIEKIQKEVKVDITHVGEPEMILTYEDPAGKNIVWSWVKTILVCLITFFGTMFSIMTFNQDVEVSKLFDTIYRQFTGTASNGMTVLEVSYAIGIGLGVIFFFNHFGKWRISHDPTPMEVEMRLYEDDVDKTVLEMEDRQGQTEEG